MFTDIVASTATLERIGDAAWHDLLVAHNARLRVELSVFRGREVKTTGDGFLAVFDSATRAVTCAAAMIRSAKAMDLPIRVGVNTGEVEFVGDDVRGIAVHAAARMLDHAGPNEVLISTTTRDLLEGSPLTLEDAGTYELKGLTGARQLFRLAAARLIGGRTAPERPSRGDERPVLATRYANDWHQLGGSARMRQNKHQTQVPKRSSKAGSGHTRRNMPLHDYARPCIVMRR